MKYILYYLLFITFVLALGSGTPLGWVPFGVVFVCIGLANRPPRPLTFEERKQRRAQGLERNRLAAEKSEKESQQLAAQGFEKGYWPQSHQRWRCENCAYQAPKGLLPHQKDSQRLMRVCPKCQQWSHNGIRPIKCSGCRGKGFTESYDVNGGGVMINYEKRACGACFGRAIMPEEMYW